MDEDIYEKFEVSDWELKNEFNPNRSRRKQSKKSQIYGVFASDSEDDEVSSGGGGKGGIINFISAGVDKSEKKKDDKEEDMIDGVDDTQPRSSYSFTQATSFNQKDTKHRFAGIRRTAKEDKNIGSWENHTKGIGAKLLSKMGWTPGTGLGKNLQGISEPIGAAPRKGKGSIGAHGPEFRQEAKFADDGSDVKSKSQSQNQRANDMESEKPRKAKVAKYCAKTNKVILKQSEDLINESVKNSWNKSNTNNNMKIIDMTGPEQKILSSFHEMHQNQHETHSRDNELEDNLDSLMSTSNEESFGATREMKRQKERYENLEDERLYLAEKCAQEKERIERVKQLLYSIDELGRDLDGQYSVDEVLDKYSQIQFEYRDEFKTLELHELLIPTVFPLIERLFQDWKPFSEPTKFKPLFEKLHETMNHDEMYEFILWEKWMPIVRKELTIWPSVRHCDEVITFLETWKRLMPEWLMNNILDQIILPRIQKEVEDWNPLTDVIPIHSWLHPWLPLMGDRSLEHIYDSIRHKLANALTNWHPRDLSAKLILEPWKEVFNPATMEAFLAINIIPKLEQIMQSFVINPHEQSLDNWHWLMSWNQMLTTRSIATILEKHFFPQWLQVLFNWLSNDANHEDVCKWYLGWKSMVSEQLQSHPSIKDSFNRALEMMNHAATSTSGMKSYKISSFPETPSLTQSSQIISNNSLSSNSSLNFKQLVEKRAEENGLLFMPIPNRIHEAKQIYRFGNLIIYIDRQVLFVNMNGNWTPTTMKSLVDLALSTK